MITTRSSYRSLLKQASDSPEVQTSIQPFKPSSQILMGRSRRQAWLALSAPSHNHLYPQRLQFFAACTAFPDDLLSTTPRHGLTNRSTFHPAISNDKQKGAKKDAEVTARKLSY
ncbi:unnamed protein product, partial [Ectocarpus sp. 4 AP-2014]